MLSLPTRSRTRSCARRQCRRHAHRIGITRGVDRTGSADRVETKYFRKQKDYGQLREYDTSETACAPFG